MTRLHVDVVHCSAPADVNIGNEVVGMDEVSYLMNVALLYTIPNSNQVVGVADPAQLYRGNALGVLVGSHVPIV